jgi:hypothetical protein
VIKHCNSSYFTMVAKDAQGKSVPVPGLILDTADSIRRFVRSMERQQHTRSRDERFRDEDFQVEDHLAQLQGQNAELRW